MYRGFQNKTHAVKQLNHSLTETAEVTLLSDKLFKDIRVDCNQKTPLPHPFHFFIAAVVLHF
jgi:hypothetical protein